MKKILTIDFDIIMTSVLEYCNEHGYDVGDGNGLAEWEQQIPELKTLQYDEKAFNYINDFIKSRSDIIFIENHDQIVEYVPLNEDYEIVNIDSHADVISGEKSDIPPEEMNCGNWVYFLFRYGKLKKYTMTGQNHSHLSKFDFEVTYLEDYEIYIDSMYNVDLNSFDEVIVCASYNYVSPKYWYIFKEWSNKES